MFRNHRDDLLASMEREREAMQQTIRILADQVDYLRFMATRVPHMSPVLADQLAPIPDEEDFSGPEEGFRPYLSEEEEELLALRLNDHISDVELANLREEVGKVIPLPSLEPDA